MHLAKRGMERASTGADGWLRYPLRQTACEAGHASSPPAERPRAGADAAALLPCCQVSDACGEEIMQYKIERNSNINKNVPLGECA